MKYKRFEQACVTNDVINVGTWACLILVGHSEGAARGVYAMKNHTASSIETIVDGGLHIEFTNPTTYELGIKYTGADPDTISVTVMYVR